MTKRLAVDDLRHIRDNATRCLGQQVMAMMACADISSHYLIYLHEDRPYAPWIRMGHDAPIEDDKDKINGYSIDVSVCISDKASMPARIFVTMSSENPTVRQVYDLLRDALNLEEVNNTPCYLDNGEGAVNLVEPDTALKDIFPEDERKRDDWTLCTCIHAYSDVAACTNWQ